MRMDEDQVLKRQKIGQLSLEGAKSHEANNLEKAVQCYYEAYNLAREVHDDKTERTCAFNLGAAYIASGEASDGLKYLHKAIPPEDQRDDRSNGDLYYNIGLGHEKMKNEDRALDDFKRANEEYSKYERDKSELQMQCLEKCYQIYQSRKDYLNVADICQRMAEVCDGTDQLGKADRLCEKVTQLRLAKKSELAKETAAECRNVLNNSNPKGSDCITAGKIMNDLGLLFTQLLDYEEAVTCFEKALELVHSSHKENNPQLEAVVLQNLGAAYNFVGDYDRAIKFHEDAIDVYAQIQHRNGQGQCFTNLAFALSQCRDLKRAEIAFHHALLAAKDTGDTHMKWQALEGLGAVNFNLGNVNDAVDYFVEALKNVGNNQTASDRIKEKMLYAVTSKKSGLSLSPFRGHDQMAYTGNFSNRRMYMSMHGPVEEHQHQLSATPRSQVVMETPIVPKQAVPVTAGTPAMSKVEDTVVKRRVIQMRKKGSIGPHRPKIAQGLGSITFDSPRVQSLRQTPMLHEETEEEDSSSTETTSSSDTTSDEDEADQAYQEQISSSQKIDQIFARPRTAEMSPGDPEQDKQLSMYEKKLQAQEENEESESESDDDDDDSDDSTFDSSDNTAEEDRKNDADEQTHVKRPVSPPPPPTQSTPNTSQVSAKILDTYLTPEPPEAPDSQELTHGAHAVQTKAEVHTPSDSLHRVDKKQSETAESPRGKPPSESDSHDEEEDSDDSDDSDKNDEEYPYATIDTSKLSRESVKRQGNETGLVHQHWSGRRGENFFDSNQSSLDQTRMKVVDKSGEDTEMPQSSTSTDDETSDETESSARKFEQLPRGQKEQIMAQYHHEHQSQGHSQEPPSPPARHEEKSSKTCVIM